jgi:hypothetical protein
MLEIIIELLLEFRIGLGFLVSFLDRQHQRHQRFGDKAPAIDAEMPLLVRAGAEGIGLT